MYTVEHMSTATPVLLPAAWFGGADAARLAATAAAHASDGALYALHSMRLQSSL